MKKILSVLLAAAVALCCIIPAFSEDDTPANAPYRISCCVNGDASSERGFLWYTPDNAVSKLIITDENGEEVSADITYEDVFEWEGGFCHKAKASSLEAGKTYLYTVGSDDVRSSQGTFRTDDADDELSFTVIADVQASSEENFAKGVATVEAAFKTLPQSEFLVNLGDFTNESDNTEWDLNDKAFAGINLSTTLVPITGNHDGFARRDWFNNMFCLDTSESVQTNNGVNYSFEYGNAHFAVVNTNDLLSVSLSQLKWLKNDLNSTDKDWKIICMHKSPYTLGKDGKWPDALYLQQSLTKVADECGVDLVLSGHDHQYLRTKPLKGNKVNDDGTVYVLAGTAGSKRYEVRSFLAGTFTDTNFINTLIIQKGGYGNYWNGSDWSETDEKNIGGCFNTVEIKGGELTFKSYILSDELTDESGEKLITNTDSFTLTKETGKNKATFSGDNTTSAAEYAALAVPSFAALAVYTFTNWLPKFLFKVPEIIKVYITEDTF